MENSQSIDEIKLLLSDYYKKLKSILSQNRAKDEAIKKLDTELEKYRKDFAYCTYKPLINQVISFRETCKKEMRDLVDYSAKYTAEKIVNNFELLFEEMEAILTENGISSDIKTENVKILPRDEKAQEEELDLTQEAEEDISEQASSDIDKKTDENESVDNAVEAEDDEAELSEAESITQMLVTFINGITKIVNEDIKLSEANKRLIESRAHTEKFFYDNIIFPARVSIAKLYASVKTQLEALKTATDTSLCEKLKELFNNALTIIVDKCEDTLVCLGVTIESEVLNNEFNPKKHRVLKLVLTDDERLNGIVAKRYTDCYIFGETVILQAKADIYKLK